MQLLALYEHEGCMVDLKEQRQLARPLHAGGSCVSPLFLRCGGMIGVWRDGLHTSPVGPFSWHWLLTALNEGQQGHCVNKHYIRFFVSMPYTSLLWTWTRNAGASHLGTSAESQNRDDLLDDLQKVKPA